MRVRRPAAQAPARITRETLFICAAAANVKGLAAKGIKDRKITGGAYSTWITRLRTLRLISRAASAISHSSRRDGRAADRGGLENRLGLTPYGGSNPSPSANLAFHAKVGVFVKNAYFFIFLLAFSVIAQVRLFTAVICLC